MVTLAHFQLYFVFCKKVTEVNSINMVLKYVYVHVLSCKQLFLPKKSFFSVKGGPISPRHVGWNWPTNCLLCWVKVTVQWGWHWITTFILKRCLCYGHNKRALYSTLSYINELLKTYNSLNKIKLENFVG